MSIPEVGVFSAFERESEERDWAWWRKREELVLAREGEGRRLLRRLYLWRRGWRIVDSEEVSRRLSKEEVVYLEAEFESGRRG